MYHTRFLQISTCLVKTWNLLLKMVFGQELIWKLLSQEGWWSEALVKVPVFLTASGKELINRHFCIHTVNDVYRTSVLDYPSGPNGGWRWQKFGPQQLPIHFYGSFTSISFLVSEIWNFTQCSVLSVLAIWFILMLQRWKEQYFVNVGTDCGLTIAGFYYVCFSCSDGSISGFYYDPNSRLEK